MFHDERRQFVVMPLNQESALAAATDAVRIASSDESSVPKPAAHERRKPLMKNQTITDLANEEDNGSHKVNGSSEGIAEGKASGITALISEAEALRTMLRDAHTQTGRLLVHIKRHKKQPTQSKQR
jgi:hypothetical protein